MSRDPIEPHSMPDGDKDVQMGNEVATSSKFKGYILKFNP
jgi:hypothetical protein